MKITCTGRKVSLKDAFMERVEKRLKKFDKFFSPDAEAGVTVTVETDWQTVEVTVRDRGFVCRAEKEAERMEDAFDDAADLLERRIVKNRKRLGTRLTAPPDLFDEPMGAAAEEDEGYHIIREKHFSVKPCTVDEAILEMNLLGHSFFLFRNADTDGIEAVYRRKDGTYGVLIPER